MDPNSFYNDPPDGYEPGEFQPLTKDWAIWSGDVKTSTVLLKHTTCKSKDDIKNNEMFLYLNFDPHKKITCIRCNKTVPKYIRKLLVLKNMGIDI